MGRMLPGLALLAILCAGCQNRSPARSRSRDEAAMFAPTTMLVHPIFTRVHDWTGDGQPDGVEALLEFQDQFGDPTKAMGRAIFELYEYRSGWPDSRGNRLSNPWIGSLVTFVEQRDRWNRTSRNYVFRLAYPAIRADRTYVLTAMFELAGGGRFFDRMILEAEEPAAPQPAEELTDRARRPATTTRAGGS